MLSTSSLLGAFSNAPEGARVMTADGIRSFPVNYTGTMMSLSNFSPVPEPSTRALPTTGLMLLCLRMRRRRT